MFGLLKQRGLPGILGTGLNNNANMLMGLGGSLLAHRQNATNPMIDPRLVMAGGQIDAENRQTRELAAETKRKANMTHAYLLSNNLARDAAEAEAIASNPVLLANALKRSEPTTPDYPSSYDEFLLAQKDPAFAQHLQAGDAAGGPRFGVNPVYGQNAAGETVIGQMSDDGTFIETPMPQGFTPLSPYGVNVQKAQGTAVGKGLGENTVAAPAALAAAQDIDKQIQSLKEDPALPQVLGPIDSKTPHLRESSHRVQAKIDQIRGGVFMQARQMLKGGGPITDYESAKAEAAYARLLQSQSPEDFKAALDEFNEAVQSGARRLAAANTGTSVPPRTDDLNDKYGLER